MYIINTVLKRSVHLVFSGHLVIKTSEHDHFLLQVNFTFDLVVQKAYKIVNHIFKFSNVQLIVWNISLSTYSHLCYSSERD